MADCVVPEMVAVVDTPLLLREFMLTFSFAIRDLFAFREWLNDGPF